MSFARRARVIRVIRVLSEMLIDSNMLRSNLHELTRAARPLASYLPLGHVRSILTRREIQPGEARRGASQAMRAEVSAKKKL